METVRPVTPPVRAVDGDKVLSQDSVSLPLFIWLSPGFPVGAFAFSHGIEWAVDAGLITNGESLKNWLEDLVTAGSIRADAVLLAAAWHARSEGDWLAVNELALALAPSRERYLETSAQGNAFLAAVMPAWPAPRLKRFVAARRGDDVAYPVAVGLAAAAHDIVLRSTLDAFILAACTALVSATVRLGPIGQTEALAVIAALCPNLTRLSAWAVQSTIEDCGTAAWGADIASMRHELQYSRLFRS